MGSDNHSNSICPSERWKWLLPNITLTFRKSGPPLQCWCHQASPGPLYDLWRIPFISSARVSCWTFCIRLHFQACICNRISGSPTGCEGHFAPLLLWRPKRQPLSSITRLLALLHPSCPRHLTSKWHLENVEQEEDGGNKGQENKDGEQKECAEKCWNRSSDLPDHNVVLVTKVLLAH